VVCLPGVCGKFDASNLDARDSKEMETPSTKDVTEMLRAWSDGDREALDKLAPVIHAELHRLAHAYMGRERPGHLLQTSALVNEAYLRLIDWENVRWQNRAHFFGVAAQMMRRILVDFARRRPKGEGGEVRHVALDEALAVAGGREADLVTLDEALDELAGFDERKARIVELRFFGGLSVEETAEVLQLSGVTVMREWGKAKAWLYRRLGGE
jgi:RNA polymerase sigma factor (TIGR02999 family)